MLILKRQVGETIYIGDDICITVTETTSSSCKIGIVAPVEQPVLRGEIYNRTPPAERQKMHSQALRRRLKEGRSN